MMTIWRLKNEKKLFRKDEKRFDLLLPGRGRGPSDLPVWFVSQRYL